MDGGDNPARIRDADGAIREEGLAALDAVVAEAGDADVRLLLLLTNNWQDFGGLLIRPTDELTRAVIACR
jgi:endo-1,4-beta-mannosidase